MKQKTEQPTEQPAPEQETVITDTFSSADRMILNFVMANNRILAEIAKKLGVELDDVNQDG